MREDKGDFYFEVVDEWDKESFEGEYQTTLSVDYIKGEDKPVYIEVQDIYDQLEDCSSIALELTKDQSLQLAYALLRINWEMEKNVPLQAQRIYIREGTEPLQVKSTTHVDNLGYK